MKHRYHIKLSPVHIAMLLNRVGDKKASDALGVTPSALRKYIRAGKAPKATELAAQSIVAGNANRPSSAIVHGSDDLLKALEAVASMSGGRLKRLEYRICRALRLGNDYQVVKFQPFLQRVKAVAC